MKPGDLVRLVGTGGAPWGSLTTSDGFVAGGLMGIVMKEPYVARTQDESGLLPVGAPQYDDFVLVWFPDSKSTEQYPLRHILLVREL